MFENADITEILQEVSAGNRTRINQLIPLVYGQLHNIAEKQLYNESKMNTINPTALAHEAYLKLMNQQNLQWNDRCHFFAIAAQSMRRIIIDYARFKKSQKRSAEKIPLTLAGEDLIQEFPPDEPALHRRRFELPSQGGRTGLHRMRGLCGPLPHACTLR